jgi:hypothetical protein
MSSLTNMRPIRVDNKRADERWRISEECNALSNEPCLNPSVSMDSRFNSFLFLSWPYILLHYSFVKSLNFSKIRGLQGHAAATLRIRPEDIREFGHNMRRFGRTPGPGARPNQVKA